jgi:N6-adenosine-specific RNA methylase IME4
MSVDEILALPVRGITNENSVLFLWIVWPMLQHGLRVIEAWGFTYKTCAFSWIKTNSTDNQIWKGTGYWTRSNSEVCLLATRGKPKRLDKSVPQGIIEPRRQHSRKPDCVYSRIEQLVEGPYVDLFSRGAPANWHAWGRERGKFE